MKGSTMTVTVTPRRTLEHVAARAGVSKATVSKVLNGRSDVAAATRERVLAVVQEVGYHPTVAKRISSTRLIVDLAFDSLVNPYSTRVLEGVVEAAAELDVDVVIARPPDPRVVGPAAYGDAWARSLVANGRGGLIVVTSELTEAQVASFGRAGMPLVVIDPINLERKDVASVGATNWAGGVSATDHLLSLGHTRIAFAGGWPKSACNREREHGYRAALEIAGIDVDVTLIKNESFTYEAGLRMGRALLERDQPPTAIFAGCDTSALGVIEAARRLGVRVPQDLSVVGFDDTSLALWSAPQLTTVRQPLADMGRVALRTLLQFARGEAPDSHHIQLATTLVVRDSTAPPAQRR